MAPSDSNRSNILSEIHDAEVLIRRLRSELDGMREAVAASASDAATVNDLAEFSAGRMLALDELPLGEERLELAELHQSLTRVLERVDEECGDEHLASFNELISVADNRLHEAKCVLAACNLEINRARRWKTDAASAFDELFPRCLRR